MATCTQYEQARFDYGVSVEDIKTGMKLSGSTCPSFGARYMLASSLAVCVRGGQDARHRWNMRRAGESF